ncbi:MAG: PadR family transcriptional regulator [Methanobacteriaceae archaeon]|jgi:DNA-binding PadR family transcriptional regulator|nr:PadR family transcriptional regulator [Methanobacteriaceae archaeon]
MEKDEYCDNEFVKEFKDSNFNSKKFFKHFPNGFLRVIILWIINKEKIHGYGIMKSLDDFFIELIEKNIIPKFNSSKIYPLLHEMESNGLILGEWGDNNNKKVKFYNTTSKGECLLKHIKFKNEKLISKDIWREFLNDLGFIID